MDGNPQPVPSYRQVAVVGSDTGVGKTAVVCALVRGLRALGRNVWVHKPVACGDWDGATADDGRRLAALVGDGQRIASICPYQFPAAAAPHLAARAVGASVPLRAMQQALDAVQGAHDLVIEGAGGLLSPLSAERAGICELLAGRDVPLLVVTHPGLGTLNHTALTVAVARSRGLRLLGLVLNRPRPVPPGLASDHAAEELRALCGLPLLGDRAHGTDEGADIALARAVLEAAAPTSP